MRPLPDFGFPRLPLVIGFTLVGLSVVAAATGRPAAYDAAAAGTPVAARDLVFEDRDDGAVVARAVSGQTVEVFEGENGFLRGTLRGLARTRKAEQIGSALPFRVARWPDGRITLDDPATGRHIELLAFGADNAAVFAHLLDGAGQAS